jgi:hypothetical protein
MMEEAQHIEVTDSPEHISQVFVTLNRYLEKEDDVPIPSHLKAKNPVSEVHSLVEGIEALNGNPIFPIKTGDSNRSFHLSTSSGNDMWFIADRWHLRQSFEGLVPLLALTVASIEKLSFLIKRLNLEHRLLSKVARGIPKIRGLSKICPQHTFSLRSKSRSIAR